MQTRLLSEQQPSKQSRAWRNLPPQQDQRNRNRKSTTLAQENQPYMPFTNGFLVIFRKNHPRFSVAASRTSTFRGATHNGRANVWTVPVDHFQTCRPWQPLPLDVYLDKCINSKMHIYLCIYVCVYIYIHIYTCTYTHR